MKSSVNLFYKYGYKSASIRDIVKAAGITNSTVYLHFKNKDEILFKIIEDVGSDLFKEIQTAIEQHDGPDDSVECLRAMIFNQICFSLETHKKVKIFLEEQFQLPHYLRKKAYKQHRQIYNLYYSKICELEEKGLLYQADKTVITFGIFAMMNWAYRWFNPDGLLSVEEVAENIIDILIRAILKNGAGKGES